MNSTLQVITILTPLLAIIGLFWSSMNKRLETLETTHSEMAKTLAGIHAILARQDERLVRQEKDMARVDKVRSEVVELKAEKRANEARFKRIEDFIWSHPSIALDNKQRGMANFKFKQKEESEAVAAH